jgi:hypothetical protein
MSGQRPWRAIVAFSDTDAVSDDWSWFYSEIRAAGAAAGVGVRYAGPEVDEVAIDMPGAPAARVDITPFRHHAHGYVLAEEGREPHYQPYDQPTVVLRAAAEYFGTDLETGS